MWHMALHAEYFKAINFGLTILHLFDVSFGCVITMKKYANTFYFFCEK